MTVVKYLDDNGLSTVWSKVKGIVTPKADKVYGATAGHLAGLNSSGNLTDSGLPATNVAQKDGSYSGMTVGAAEDLVSAESVASEFTSRITGGSTAVGKGGTALVDKIKGRTLVWNQLVQNGNFASSTNNWAAGVAATSISVSNGVLRVSVISGTNISNMCASQDINTITDHKYLIRYKLKNHTNTGTYYVGYLSAPTQWIGSISLPNQDTETTASFILTANNNRTRIMFGLYRGSSAGTSYFEVGDYVDYSNITCIDLTLMFGAGNEPSTVAEFEALYPLPYYDYNTGTLISNAATAIETVGWNIWDEELEDYSYNQTTGEKQQSGAATRSKNKFSVIPGTSLYLNLWGSTSGIRFFKYAADGSYLGTETSYGKQTYTVPSGVYLIAFQVSSSVYPLPYKNNICISLSDPSRNGTYEPYWRSELELGLGDIKVKSHNLWDEEWEVGAFNTSTGEKSTANNTIRSKNYIPVLPNTTYYAALAPKIAAVYYYDSNKAFISFEYNSSGTRTTPANCYYMMFVGTSTYGTTYANDICINLSDPAFDGRYEPYGDGGVISITGGLKSAGTTYDEIVGGKYIQRIDKIILGDLSWSIESTYNRLQSGAVPTMLSTGPRLGQIINPKYESITDGRSAQDALAMNKVIYTSSQSLYVQDSSYSSAATFKADMAGVPLYYTLATPIEYELADAIPTAMRNDPYGTERRLPEDTAAIVTAPFRADITYSTNIKEAVQSLPQNYINVNSMQDFLAALGAQMGGTWTMSPADGKFDFTFTPNPVEPTL